jgi:hypothetical protein
MLRWLISGRLAAFERAYGYDVSYVRDMLDIDWRTVLMLNRVATFAAYRRDVPPAPWHAAKIVGVLHEDCGPCTQLAVRLAERAKVPGEVIRAVLAGDEGSMPDDVELAVRFARAVLTRDPELASVQQSIIGRFGRRGHLSLAFAVTSARLFPTLKYALGHGHACTRIEVGGSMTPVLRKAA